MFSKYISKVKQSYIFRNYAKMYGYIKPYKFRALIAVLVSVPIGILDAAIPGGLKYYIDGITSGHMSKIVTCMPLLIVLFTLIQSALTYISNYVNAWVGTNISNGLKHDLYEKLMRCTASFFDANASGNVQMRFNSDVDMACAGLLNNVKNFTKSCLTP